LLFDEPCQPCGFARDILERIALVRHSFGLREAGAQMRFQFLPLTVDRMHGRLELFSGCSVLSGYCVDRFQERAHLFGRSAHELALAIDGDDTVDEGASSFHDFLGSSLGVPRQFRALLGTLGALAG
jgi:hypothetical protein